MSAAASIAAAQPSLRAPLVYSLLFHGLLFALMILSAVFSNRGEGWGGAESGAAVTVGLVAGLNVPLPQESASPSQVVDVSKGLYKEEQRPPEPPAKAEEIPQFPKQKPPRPSHPSRVFENPVPPPPNAVPYGQGGVPAVSSTTFTIGGTTQGGLGMTGSAGGNFGSRYPWYVEAVQRRISGNWLMTTVDPSVRQAPRVVVTFQVHRDGSISNIDIQQSSGNQSVDDSARRAVLGSNPLPALPGDYSASSVNVEFWFDFQR